MPITPVHLKTGIFLACLFIIFQQTDAQDFVIKHDLQKDSTNFYMVGKPMDTLKVNVISLKKPGRITLDVENYNPFYWNAKVTTFKRPTEDQSSYVGSFISSLAKIGGFPELQIPGGRLKGKPANINEKYAYLATLYADIYNRINILYKKPQEMKVLEMYLGELRRNPHKTEIEIKSEAKSAVVKVIGPEALDFNYVVTVGGDLDEKKAALEEKKEEMLDSLTVLKQELDQLEHDPSLDMSYEVDTLNIKDISTNIKITDRYIKSTKGKATSQFSYLEELSSIRNLYSEIINTSFKFSYTVSGNTDINQLKLQVFPRSDSLLRADAKDTITRYFPIKAKASLRLRSSAGVTFTYFQDKNRSYYITQDTTIGTGKGDLFTPVISTFINFFNYNPAGFKWGGSFGFGIPLVGDKKDINFMLGLCAIIGRNEPIIISAGVAGTKVNRLTEGWKTGQHVPGLNFDIPTLSQFRAGGYLSITFNLGNLIPNSSDNN